jgi:superoxide dismutase, Fe-Mn family
MNIEPPAIPYNYCDLEPAMSRDTLVFHYLRHQRGCFDRLRALLAGTEMESVPLDELIRVTERNPSQHDIYRAAAELWNHNLYWNSMRPKGGGPANGVIGELLRARFGSYERFTREFRAAAMKHFGSGWLFLVLRAGVVEILTTSNAGTPLVRGDTALLALDLWEHAYFLDYQNRRGAYVTAFLEDLVNWEGVNRLLTESAARAAMRVPLAAANSAGVIHPGISG